MLAGFQQPRRLRSRQAFDARRPEKPADSGLRSIRPRHRQRRSRHLAGQDAVEPATVHVTVMPRAGSETWPMNHNAAARASDSVTGTAAGARATATKSPTLIA